MFKIKAFVYIITVQKQEHIKMYIHVTNFFVEGSTYYKFLQRNFTKQIYLSLNQFIFKLVLNLVGISGWLKSNMRKTVWIKQSSFYVFVTLRVRPYCWWVKITEWKKIVNFPYESRLLFLSLHNIETLQIVFFVPSQSRLQR